MAIAPRLKRSLARAALSAPPAWLRRAAGAARSVDGPPLDAQVQLLMRLGDALGEQRFEQLPVTASRRLMLSQTSIVDLPRAPGVEVASLSLPLPSGGSLRARLYRPARASRPSPALLYFHGGGFVVGDLASHDGVCSWMAHASRTVVLAVDYRRAPEYVFPAAIDDGLAAWRAVLARREQLGLGALGVGGDSAGGNLATVVCLESRRLGLPQPALQMLVYPVTDVTGAHPSRELFSRGFYLERTTIDWFRDHYLPDPAHHRDPRASPLLADDLAGLAPALLVTAGFDALRDEGQRYAARLREAGVPVEEHCATTLPHGFWSMGGVIDEARRWVIQLSERAGDMLRSAPSTP